MIRSHLNPNADHFGGSLPPREDLPVCYEWLKPCETVLAHAQREGPLRRGNVQQRATASTGDLPRPRLDRPGVLPSAGAGVLRAKQRSGRLSNKVVAGHELWATGAPSANYAPPSHEDLLWRHATSTALKAATGACARPALGTHGGNAVAEGRRRRAAAKAAAAKPRAKPARDRKSGAPAGDLPEVEAWDSISQAPTVPSPRGDGGDCEVMSVQTATESRFLLQPHERWDRDIATHFARHRSGWYDWRGERIIG